MPSTAKSLLDHLSFSNCFIGCYRSDLEASMFDSTKSPIRPVSRVCVVQIVLCRRRFPDLCPVKRPGDSKAEALPIASVCRREDGNHYRDRSHPTVLARFEVAGIDPKNSCGGVRPPRPTLRRVSKPDSRKYPSSPALSPTRPAFGSRPPGVGFCTTEESALSALLCGSNSDGKQLPLRTLGTESSTVPP
jgi:hypothetical protein